MPFDLGNTLLFWRFPTKLFCYRIGKKMFTDSLSVWKFPKGMVENWIRELWLSVLAVCV